MSEISQAMYEFFEDLTDGSVDVGLKLTAKPA